MDGETLWDQVPIQIQIDGGSGQDGEGHEHRENAAGHALGRGRSALSSVGQKPSPMTYLATVFLNVVESISSLVIYERRSGRHGHGHGERSELRTCQARA